MVNRETMGGVSPGNLDICDGNENVCDEKKKKTVTVLDPRRTVSLLIRAANLIATEIDKPHEVDSTIVMAQMPRTEAEELGAHLRETLKKMAGREEQPYRVDLILSEAQLEHASPNVKLAYGRDDLTPVLTPHPAFDTDVKGLVQPVSSAEVQERGVLRRLSNSRRYHVPWEGVTTTLFQLEKELGLPVIPGADEFTLLPDDETKTRAIELVLRELQVSSHADVVVLERRDFYLDDLPYGYTDYKVCDQPPDSIKTELQKVPDWDKWCRLHVALDRILWKGDYSSM